MNDEITWWFVFMHRAPADSVILGLRDNCTMIGFCRVSQYVGDCLEDRLTRVPQVDPGVEIAVAVVAEIGIEHELIFSMAAESGVRRGQALGTYAAERGRTLGRLGCYMVGSGWRRREVEMAGIVIGCGRSDLRQLV